MESIWNFARCAVLCTVCATGFFSSNVFAEEGAEGTPSPSAADEPSGEVADRQEQGRQNEMKDEITVWGEGKKETNYFSPDSILIPEDVEAISTITTEDLVKYEPSLVVRRRFIGDANGVIGMRGSNMFQTARTMVFADGIPLHYHLQTRWSGAPRWGLVNADELGFVEVVYGPFSAEYGGNAMGGVVNIETRIPTERHFHLEGVLMQQAFDADGFDDTLGGFKGFLSYGEKFGKLSVYAALTRLENEGQPQDFRFGTNSIPTGDELAVSGSLQSTDEYDELARYYGNSGPVDSETDQFKVKVGYEFDNGWFALFNTGYEVRNIVRDGAINYLAGTDGLPVWGGTVVEDGAAFSVRGRNFNVDEQDRRTLLLGGRLTGPINDHWSLEASVSFFDILEDETRASLLNPADPEFTSAGTVRDYDDAAWQSAEVKLQNDSFAGRDDLSLVTGYRYEHYELGVTNYDSDDFAGGARTVLNNASGGESRMQALFAQVGWTISDRWDLAFGGRLESWESENGFFNNRGVLDDQIDRSEERFSPKFSIGYQPNKDWQLRWSSARAFRFPIVEELFQNERRTNGTSIADANLEPEDGIHHNLMVERRHDGGSVRLNLFTETIDDVIFNQSSIVDNVRVSTFLPIDEVVTDGVELVVEQSDLANGKLRVRFNTTFIDAEITENSANRDLEGNAFPRMPEWRSHLLLNYAFNERWSLGGGVRYSSDSFGDLDNRDTAEGVFGAHDEYTQVNLKAGLRLNDATRLNFGIDNVTDEVAYVHHPWPGRTGYVEIVVDQ